MPAKEAKRSRSPRKKDLQKQALSLPARAESPSPKTPPRKSYSDDVKFMQRACGRSNLLPAVAFANTGKKKSPVTLEKVPRGCIGVGETPCPKQLSAA